MTARMLTVTKSANRKTGRVALALYRTQDTCPPTCPLMNAGCYGENNGPGGSAKPFGHAARGNEVSDYASLRSALDKVQSGAMIRANVVGDYLDVNGAVDLAYVSALNDAASRGIQILSYTHAWRTIDSALFIDSARPQASCDTADDVAHARALGWSTVIVGDITHGDDLHGTKAVMCPNVTHGIQCVDCGLCARQRQSTIVFPVHGTQKRRAAEAMTCAIEAQT